MKTVRAVVDRIRLALGIDRPAMRAQARLHPEALRRANVALAESRRLERLARSHR